MCLLYVFVHGAGGGQKTDWDVIPLVTFKCLFCLFLFETGSLIGTWNLHLSVSASPEHTTTPRFFFINMGSDIFIL